MTTTYNLPPIRDDKTLDFPHFPTRFQAFIYRNWDTIKISSMAKILETDCQTIRNLARDMGLEEENYNNDWLKKGYITLIRANFHLLTYEQICTMLEISMEELAFILKEDDFLSHKLGHFKPNTPTIKYRELSKEEKDKTKEIHRATKKIYNKTKEVEAMPFSFDNNFKSLNKVLTKTNKESIFKNRIIYSYCALYGDMLLSKKDIDESFPDSLLEAYEKTGVNSLWMQAILYTLAPFPFDLSLSKDHKKRLESLNYLIAKLKKYNIKLFLYLNEPRSMPGAFYEKYPNLKGEEEEGFYAMCTSTKEVQDYLRDSCYYLVKNTKGLGGFLTITASENLTNCFSRTRPENMVCPRCTKRHAYEIIAKVNNLIYEGARAANKDIEVIAWTWAWYGNTDKIIERLDKNIGIMSVSEQGVKKLIGGIETSVLDYSISIIGPGDYSLATWEKAIGHTNYAKIQANVTWECAAVPFIPVFDNIYKHVKGIIESGLVGNLMLGWTLGGYPSANLLLITHLLEAKEKLPSLEEIIENIYTKEYKDRILKASNLFSKAFDEFPFHIQSAYLGPQNYGPSNLLYEKETHFSASMVGYPYDDLEAWRAIFPRDLYIEQTRKLSQIWQEGLKALDLKSQDPLIKDLLDSAKALYCHFRSMYLQALFVSKREDNKECLAIINEEKALCLDLLDIMATNPTIGYEPSNHYFYTRAQLMEKYINLDYLWRVYDKSLL